MSNYFKVEEFSSIKVKGLHSKVALAAFADMRANSEPTIYIRDYSRYVWEGSDIIGREDVKIFGFVILDESNAFIAE